MNWNAYAPTFIVERTKWNHPTSNYLPVTKGQRSHSAAVASTPIIVHASPMASTAFRRHHPLIVRWRINWREIASANRYRRARHVGWSVSGRSRPSVWEIWRVVRPVRNHCLQLLLSTSSYLLIFFSHKNSSAKFIRWPASLLGRPICLLIFLCILGRYLVEARWYAIAQWWSHFKLIVIYNLQEKVEDGLSLGFRLNVAVM